ERSVLRRLAPHLALPVRMVMPTHGRAGHAKLGLGLWTFERIATVAPEERHAMWSREEALAREPTLDGTRLHGAATFIEYQTCDARLVHETVLGAHAAGARPPLRLRRAARRGHLPRHDRHRSRPAHRPPRGAGRGRRLPARRRQPHLRRATARARGRGGGVGGAPAAPPRGGQAPVGDLA